MKLITSIFSLFLFITLVSSQDETINISFVEAEPLWEYVVVDTNFINIPGQPYFTKYTSLFPGSIKRHENFLFILSHSKEPGSIVDDYGFVLDKIEINTGENQWTHYNTISNNGNQDHYERIELTNQGDICLFGVERFGPDGPLNWSLGGYNSNLIWKVFDYTTGELKEIFRSTDSLFENPLPCRQYRNFIIDSDSLYLTTFQIGENIGSISNPIFNYGINIKVLDKNFASQNETRLLFDFDSLGVFSIDQPSFIHRLGKNTIIGLAYKDRFESYDEEIQLMWIDISDPNNPIIQKIINLNNILPGSKESYLLHRFNAINNTIHLSHFYPNFDIQENACYILWLSDSGEIKTFIAVPRIGEHIYNLCDMIYSNNDFAYLYAFPSITGRSGFDILRIDNGVDTIQYISSLTSEIEGEEFTKNFNIHKFYDDGYFIIGGYTSKEGEKEKTALKIYCFKAEDLDLISNTNELADNNINKIFLYPNPTDDIIEINFPNFFTGQVSVYNIDGIRVVCKNLDSRKKTKMTTSLLKAGIYFIFAKNDKEVYKATFVKK